MQPDRLVAHLCKQSVQALEQVAGYRLVGRQQASGNEIAFQQGGQGLVAEVVHRQGFPMFEGAGRAHRVEAAEELAEAEKLVQVARLGGAAATAGEQGEAEAGVLEQAFTITQQRRHHGHFTFRQFGAETVFLTDRRVAPALRAIELGDQRLGVFDAHLVDAVLVAVQREDACVAEKAEAFHGIQYQVGGEVIEGVGHGGAPAVRRPVYPC
ncbi:hypothetical protein D9M68_465600 [compost metagenome]